MEIYRGRKPKKCSKQRYYSQNNISVLGLQVADINSAVVLVVIALSKPRFS